MSELISEPGFENGAGLWTPGGPAGSTFIFNDIPYEGLDYAVAGWAQVGGFKVAGTWTHVLAPTKGAHYSAGLWVNRLFGIGPAIARIDLGGGSALELQLSSPTGVWTRWDLAAAAGVERFRGLAAGSLQLLVGTGGASPPWYGFDLVEVQEVFPMADSKLETFLANLKTVVEAVDDNVGEVFIAERLWSSDQEIVDDGGVKTISVEGLFDGAGMLGETVTRFWILEPLVESSRLTNGSNEHKNTIRLLGFYGRREDESTVITLRKAAVEILDRLKDKSAETGTLAAGMGAGYEGFLMSTPQMLEPPRSAMLAESGIPGSLVRLEVTYFEEVETT